MRVLLLVTITVLASCASTTGDESSSAPRQAAATAEASTSSTSESNLRAAPGVGPDGTAASEVVCTRERVTGSYRTTKVCRTRAQIDHDAEEAKRFSDDVRRESLSVQSSDG